MNERAGIVIIGGGIIGTSIAYHLAKRGVASDVLVLEENTVGSGTTSAAGGGIRSQFSTEVNIRFSLESVALYASAVRSSTFIPGTSSCASAPEIRREETPMRF